MHGDASLWLATYVKSIPALDFADNVSIRLDSENEIQPDLCAWISKEFGGSAVATEEYLEGAPDLVIEVAASSAAMDLGDKLKAYRRNGVREYVVLEVHEQQTHWYMLENGVFKPHFPDADGVWRSRIFPGLWFQHEHFWRRDWGQLKGVLDQGMDSAEFKTFATPIQVKLTSFTLAL